MASVSHASPFPSDTQCTAFAGTRRIASGELRHVAAATKVALDQGENDNVLIFCDATSRVIEVDFRGTPEEVQQRLPEPTAASESSPEEAPEEPAPRGPGRPKLGVVAREITLLPRHWDWLNDQPGGASVTLRKLVEQARKAGAAQERIRKAQEATTWFLSAMAGDLAGLEEAMRALYRADAQSFADQTANWPPDIRDHARKLAGPALTKHQE